MNIGNVLGVGSVVFLLSLGGCGQSAFDSVNVLAENGDPRSQLELGKFYAEGLGVSEDAADDVAFALVVCHGLFQLHQPPTLSLYITCVCVL